MKEFSSLRFEVKSDERDDWLTIRGELPEGSPGLRYVWFVLTRPELDSVVRGKVSTLTDGTHKVIVHGDRWTFYDLDVPCRENAGTMAVKYLSVDMPMTFMRGVYRLARKTWALMKKARDADAPENAHKYDRPTCVEIVITPEHADRVLRLYGQGKGDVVLDFGDYKGEETATFLAACQAEGGETFKDGLERIQCIARNSTSGFHQRATVRISKDWDGFYWEARSPRGRRLMNGGLINHGARDNSHNWSVHT